jgi:hypothetical protein
VNLDVLREHRFPVTRVTYADKDTILYALSVGAGADPLDAHQLRLVYEKDLSVLPTIAAVLAHPGAWISNPRFGVDYPKLLHGEQYLLVHRPLAPQGEIDASYRIAAVVDKGEGKGALLYFEKQLRDAASSELLCTVRSTLFLRGDGGAGSFGTPPEPLPNGLNVALEALDELKTPMGAALLYRLNGDRNPLHADPAAALQAGFENGLQSRSLPVALPRCEIQLPGIPRGDHSAGSRPKVGRGAFPGDGTRAKRRRPEPRLRAHRLRRGCRRGRVGALHGIRTVAYYIDFKL